MSQPQHGGLLTRVYSEFVADPRYGPAIREVWKGHRSSLLSLSAEYNKAGFRVEYSDNEGLGQLTVTLPAYNDGTPEVPTDTWEIITEFIQVSIWNNPRIRKAAAGDEETVAYWKKRTQNALVGNFAQAGTDPLEYEALDPNSREPLTPAEAGFDAAGPEPYLFRIYTKLLRGEDAYEIRRIVLKLSRVVSPGYAGRAIIDPIDKVYTSAALKRIFAVPDAIYRLLPIAPTDPTLLAPQTVWSWKLRQDSSQIILSAAKVQETKDWIFAAWDIDLYELVS